MSNPEQISQREVDEYFAWAKSNEVGVNHIVERHRIEGTNPELEIRFYLLNCIARDDQSCMPEYIEIGSGEERHLAGLLLTERLEYELSRTEIPVDIRISLGEILSMLQAKNVTQPWHFTEVRLAHRSLAKKIKEEYLM